MLVNLIQGKTYLISNHLIMVNFLPWLNSLHHIPIYGLLLIIGLLILIYGWMDNGRLLMPLLPRSLWKIVSELLVLLSGSLNKDKFNLSLKLRKLLKLNLMSSDLKCQSWSHSERKVCKTGIGSKSVTELVSKLSLMLISILRK